MASKGRAPRRLSRGEVDAAAPVALWFLLTALAGQGESMVEHARAFCAELGNARVVDADSRDGNHSGVRYVYVVVDGGALGDAVRGGDAAVAAVITARALASRLFMFSPALVPEPSGQQSA